MANFCNYCVAIIGQENNCVAFSWLLPYMEEPAMELDSETLGNGLTKLIVSGSCKNGLDSYTYEHSEVSPLSVEEIDEICFKGTDKYDAYTVREKSILCNVEVYAASIGEGDNYENIYSEYYDKGEISFQYDDSVAEELEDILKEKFWTKVVRVRFTDGKSYLYEGNYEPGTIVYVDGAKAGILGMVTSKDYSNNAYNLYSVSRVLGKVEQPEEEDLYVLFNSFSKEEKRTAVQKLGRKTVNADSFISGASSAWIEKAFNDKVGWEDFLIWLGKEAVIADFTLPDLIENRIQEKHRLELERELAEKKRMAEERERKEAEKTAGAAIEKELDFRKADKNKRDIFFYQKKYGREEPAVHGENKPTFICKCDDQDGNAQKSLHVGTTVYIVSAGSINRLYIYENDNKLRLISRSRNSEIIGKDCTGKIGYMYFSAACEYSVRIEIDEVPDEHLDQVKEELRKEEQLKNEESVRNRLEIYEQQKELREKEKLARKTEADLQKQKEREEFHNRDVQRIEITDEFLQKKLDRLFERLEVFYPEHAIFALDAISKDLREKSTEIAKQIGYNDYYDMFKAYGWRTLQGNEVKEIRNTVIYTPGNEPDFIKTRVQNTMENLDIYYPSHVIEGSIQNEHSNISSTITGLYQWFGYDTVADFLKAYGFEYKVKSSGRPSSVNPDEIIAKLKERSGGKPYASMKELQEANKDISGKLKSLANKAMDYFGMTLKKYLQSQGLL